MSSKENNINRREFLSGLKPGNNQLIKAGLVGFLGLNAALTASKHVTAFIDEQEAQEQSRDIHTLLAEYHNQAKDLLQSEGYKLSSQFGPWHSIQAMALRATTDTALKHVFVTPDEQDEMEQRIAFSYSNMLEHYPQHSEYTWQERIYSALWFQSLFTKLCLDTISSRREFLKLVSTSSFTGAGIAGLSTWGIDPSRDVQPSYDNVPRKVVDRLDLIPSFQTVIANLHTTLNPQSLADLQKPYTEEEFYDKKNRLPDLLDQIEEADPSIITDKDLILWHADRCTYPAYIRRCAYMKARQDGFTQRIATSSADDPFLSYEEQIYNTQGPGFGLYMYDLLENSPSVFLHSLPPFTILPDNQKM